MCGVSDDHRTAVGPGRHVAEVIGVVPRQPEVTGADQLCRRTGVALNKKE